jgi:hypothetical protein
MILWGFYKTLKHGPKLNDRRPIQEHRTQWMVLCDPEGNEFCIYQIGKIPDDDDGFPAP